MIDEVVYLGRKVSKEGFRVFMHGEEGSKKLVNSWEEFQDHLGTGMWFASEKDVPIKGKREKKKDE